MTRVLTYGTFDLCTSVTFEFFKDSVISDHT